MQRMGILSIPLLLTSCVSMDICLVDPPPPVRVSVVPHEEHDKRVNKDRLVLLPYPHKPSIGTDVHDHSAIESILIKHINELHRVNNVNIQRATRYKR